VQLVKTKPKAEEPINFWMKYPERDQAYSALWGAISRIRQPRHETRVPGYGTHWLPTPEPPKEDDRGAVKRYREELERIGAEERRLLRLAEEANGITDGLIAWKARIYRAEMGLEQASKAGALTEDDLPDLAAVQRDHDRFIRACQSWIQRLAIREDVTA